MAVTEHEQMSGAPSGACGTDVSLGDGLLLGWESRTVDASLMPASLAAARVRLGGIPFVQELGDSWASACLPAPWPLSNASRWSQPLWLPP